MYRGIRALLLVLGVAAGADRAAVARTASDNRVAAGDTHLVTFVGHEEFTKVVVVSAAGRIRYPFVSRENVIGMRRRDLEDRIAGRIAPVLGRIPHAYVTEYSESTRKPNVPSGPK